MSLMYLGGIGLKIKMCGLFKEEDLEYANIVRPDFIGFVFAKSKRQVTKEFAALLREKLKYQPTVVGVFVDEDPYKIISLVNEKVIDWIQLHGNESPDYIEELNRHTTAKIVKALIYSKNQSMDQFANQINEYKDVADYLLIDSGSGSGETFSWEEVKQKLDELLPQKDYFIAGGLNCENIRKAAMLFNPFALDLSSGLETNGVKDLYKMMACKEGVNMEQNNGRYGVHGGQYVPETLMNELINLEKEYLKLKTDPEFMKELDYLLKEYAGRPSLLYYADKMTKDLGGAKIYLKREDLNHTGSHKINNVLGQALMAKKMGKTRVIAETGAGQHGVATATAAALLGLECEIFMGEEDTIRQALNVYRMELLGAKVNPVKSGTKTLKDAVNDAMREWTSRIHDTHYVFGSVMGPHPFPMIVRDFQSVISSEAREEILAKEGKLPKAVVACVGGGSNAMGMFYNFIKDSDVELIGCEAAGEGVDTPRTAATLATGSLGVFHGMKSYFCQDEYGQIAPVYSISAGLDYPGIGPEHAYLSDIKRAQYVPVTDDEAVEAFEYLAKTEGIICAIESAHAIAHVQKIAKNYDPSDSIIVCLSGRGDKDVAAIARYKGVNIHE